MTRQRPSSAFARPDPSPLAGRTILQIIPELEAGGAERTTVDIAAGLAGAGARALVATEGGRLVGELQAKGGIWIPFPAGTKNPFAMLANVAAPARASASTRASTSSTPARAPRPGSRYGAARALRPALRDHLSRQLCRPLRGEDALQFGHGARRRRHRQLALHGRPDRAGCIRSARERVRVIHRGTDFAAFSPSAVEPERVEALRGAGASRRTSASCCSPPG